MQNNPEYRLLNSNETIQEGDEFFSSAQTWERCRACIGQPTTFFQNNNAVRRRAYRLMAAGEIALPSDERLANDKWAPCGRFEYTIPKHWHEKFRRQIEFPTKLVEAFASPWNQWVSIFSTDGNFLLVRDYVNMGKGIHGFRRKVEVPLRPSSDWRFLTDDERTYKGDEVSYCAPHDKWAAVDGLHGMLVSNYASCKFRRKVEATKPEPNPGEGYVLLKKGDVIQEGDEYFEEGCWQSYVKSVGSTVHFRTPSRRAAYISPVAPAKQQKVDGPRPEQSESDLIKGIRADIEAITKRVRDIPGILYTEEQTIARQKLDEAFMWLGCDLKRIKEENKSAKSNS